MAYIVTLLLIACIAGVGAMMAAREHASAHPRRRPVGRGHHHAIDQGGTSDSAASYILAVGDGADAHHGSCDTHGAAGDCGGGHH
jgi:hypothetical protein